MFLLTKPQGWTPLGQKGRSRASRYDEGCHCEPGARSRQEVIPARVVAVPKAYLVFLTFRSPSFGQLHLPVTSCRVGQQLIEELDLGPSHLPKADLSTLNCPCFGPHLLEVQKGFPSLSRSSGKWVTEGKRKGEFGGLNNAVSRG